MQLRPLPHTRDLATALLVLLLGQAALEAQSTPPSILGAKPLTNEIQISFKSAAGVNSRLETSSNLTEWKALYTFPPTTAVQTFSDSTRFSRTHFYRIVQLDETNAVTGDHLQTGAGDLVVHPVNHASFVMIWNHEVIYVDPVGGASRYAGLPRPTVVFITDIHSDHMDSLTLNSIAATNGPIITPLAVFQQLSSGLRAVTRVLTNGGTLEVAGMSVLAIPMYNTTAARLSYHTKGRGNGYVITLGGRRVYVSGDTEDIPEMRALQSIDAAFVCMNLPFTMDVDQAVSAVRQFQPRVVYPFHYSGSDVERFKRLVGADLPVEVRLRKWY